MERRLIKFVLLGFAAIAFLILMMALLFFLTRPEEKIDASTTVGFVEKSFTDSTRNRVLDTYLWFPTEDNIDASLIRSNALFFGFSAKAGARPPAASAPLVILSHGSGGNNGNQGWLAVELAKRGAIVIAPNHPGSTSRDSAAETNIQAWNRPQDISFVLDAVLADPGIAELVDKERVALIGHSLGGYTVLGAGGASLSKSAFIEYCNLYPHNPDCVFYAGGGVDLAQIDQSKFEQSHKDNRIKAIVAIDPAYARSFDQSSLRDLPPILLITPSVEKDTIDDLQVGYLREQLVSIEHPDVQSLTIDGAHHFSFLPRCKPFAYTILGAVEKGAEVLCAEEKGVTREAVHSNTTERVMLFLSDVGVID